MAQLWMKVNKELNDPYIVVYRCCFQVEKTQTISFKYSADERAQLFLDGQAIERGPERGAPQRWYYQTGSFTVDAGEHVLTSRVICFGFHKWAYAQLSIQHGFFFEDDAKLLNNWKYQIEDGCSFEPGFPDWGVFPRIHLTKEHNNEILLGKGGAWLPVAYYKDNRNLYPPDLPKMKYVKVEPDSIKDNIYYFKDYLCAWANYRFTGKGTVKIRWTETPYQTANFDENLLKGQKGKRDGKYIVGNFDTFEVDGQLHWYDYYWRAGHYVQIIVEGNVTVEAQFYRTGYPYKQIKPKSKLEEISLATLYNCSHETYVDCPYFEQLMYISDSRLEALCTYKITNDHRLPAKALRMFALSQRPDGSLNAQYPSRSFQTIPYFMVIWFLMVEDYYLIHGNDSLVEELRPYGEKLLDYLLSNIKESGLLEIEGWNFTDWYPAWKSGVASSGPNCVLNWFFIMALQAIEKLNWRSNLSNKIKQIHQKIRENFFDEEKQLYAMDKEKTIFSEHPQVLALLANNEVEVINGLEKEDLIPCSISFSYYYLAACKKFNLTKLLKNRIAKWKKLEDEGLTTFPEEFENPRSDCHAWSSHVMLFLD